MALFLFRFLVRWSVGDAGSGRRQTDELSRKMTSLTYISYFCLSFFFCCIFRSYSANKLSRNAPHEATTTATITVEAKGQHGINIFYNFQWPPPSHLFTPSLSLSPFFPPSLGTEPLKALLKTSLRLSYAVSAGRSLKCDIFQLPGVVPSRSPQKVGLNYILYIILMVYAKLLHLTWLHNG